MESIIEFLQLYLGNDLKAAGIIILNLIIIEGLLSIDNAAVLATMVMDLPKEQRARALRIGLVFAYIFRGLALIFASVLMGVVWLKALGALYLIFLGYDYFKTKATPSTEDDILNKNENFIYRNLKKYLGSFWATVAMVETMDMVFSIDNVFAAVAFTDNIYLICFGVFIGILTMRFVAGIFVTLMERFPLLEPSAFIVVTLLGLKLLIASYCDTLTTHNWLCEFLEGHNADFYFSIITVSIFLFPILVSFIKKKKDASV